VSRDGKWNPNVSTREIGDRARENGADQGDVLLSTVDGVYVTLRIISHQARGFLEEGQHPFDDPQIKLDRREKSDHIISIELGTKTEVIPAQLLEQAPRVSLAEQGMEALHHQHKEHGRGGGVPFRWPRLWKIRSPGTSLRRILVLAVERRVDIQFVQMRGQPIVVRRSRRKTHPKESKALVRSILNMILGNFRPDSDHAMPRTYLKLSWIRRPLIKALWFGEMRVGRWGAKLLAAALEKNFPKRWIWLIGR
jgi:hypothetical protein